MTVQAYVLPIPNGWGVVTYGGDDPRMDDEIVPLPYTNQMPYDAVVASFEASPLGESVVTMVDGWATLTELRRHEPELARRAWVML